MTIYLGSDHAGFERKEQLKNFLTEKGYAVRDLGAEKLDTDDDYPDLIQPVAEKVAEEDGAMGIIFGGSGQGEAMVANRVKGVRAAVYYGPQVPTSPADIEGRTSDDSREIVRLARMHNDANILSLGARFIGIDEMKDVAVIFLETKFEGAARHIRRIQKMD